MIGEAAEIRRDDTISCDVCIIGGGAAGITIARELAGTKQRVVLLESGGETREEATQQLYDGELRGAVQFPLMASRLRFFGGTTNHWAGMCRPLDALDFRARAWVPHSGWPIDRAALDPYYRRAHEVCELGPYGYGEETWGDVARLPAKLRPDPELVVKLAQHSPPTRFGSRYRDDLEKAANVRVVLHANATAIVPDAGGRTVRHVQVKTLDGHAFRVAARRTVVACGGIENARLLLLSNEVVPTGLGNGNDLVGRFFLDHPAAMPFAVILFFDAGVERIARHLVRNEMRLQSGLCLTDPVLEREGLLNHAVYMRKPTSVESVRDFAWLGIDDLLGPQDLRIAETVERLWHAHGEADASICWIRSEQAPDPSSRVLLSDDARDALGQRRVVVDWRPNDLNRHTFVTSARMMARKLSESGAARLKLMPWLVEDGALSQEEWWPGVAAGWHHMGTTRMSQTPDTGVVDPDCRVHGVDNLYVAGSSVFPTTGYINPTLTLLALALRLADHLRGPSGG